MLEEEFNKKHPDVKWDFPLEEDESYRGYPVIRIVVPLNYTLDLDISSCTVESCLDIADKIIQKLNELDLSENEKYVERALYYHEQYFNWKKDCEENKKCGVKQ